MELPLRLRLIQMLSASERLWQPHPADWLREHDNMADDQTTKVGGQDRKRINLSGDHEVRTWCNSLGVNEEQLRTAVAAVGDNADKVRQHLGKK
jgi:hypothetical protein